MKKQEMVKLTIDNAPVEVDSGTTLLDAARKLGIEIPTMCFLEGRSPTTSCMVCVVKVRGSDNLLPACAALAEDKMIVESETEEVHRARRAALELLLSDHVGDCMGPCQVICPAHMNIPLMIRQIAAGALRDAIATVKRDIALPAILGRICPAPCEKGCRRSQADSPLAICLLKRYVADADLNSSQGYLPTCSPKSGKKVAIVGAGPAGLAGAFHLLRYGHDCVLFDDHPKLGGMLQYGVPEDRLPREVVDAEIALIPQLGAEFRPNMRLGEHISLGDLRKDFDAALLAAGKLGPEQIEQLGLPSAGQPVSANRKTFETELEGVFAAGNIIRPNNALAVRAVADGKDAATSIDQYLRGQPVTGPQRPFNTHIGKLLEGEIAQFMTDTSRAGRVQPAGGDTVGFTENEATQEARRCLHCDCRKPDRCKLRECSQLYQAAPRRYKADRRRFEQRRDHPQVIYEPGKCIDCGICIRIAREEKAPLGLTFIGRGFDVRVGVPFNRSLTDALKKAAARCVETCPTGALAFKNDAPSEPS